jgi:hypothetical protein
MLRDAGFPKSTALLAAMTREFPHFGIRSKRDVWHQRAIHVLLMLLTLGGQRVYLTHYHTVLFGKLWVPDSWNTLSDVDRYILLRHERVHLEQNRRWGAIGMALRYLVPFFPVGLAYGRARIEWEAYEETMRATYEEKGRAAVVALETYLVTRFTGPDYGWMWPFPTAVRRWFATTLRQLDDEMATEARTETSEAVISPP